MVSLYMNDEVYFAFGGRMLHCYYCEAQVALPYQHIFCVIVHKS